MILSLTIKALEIGVYNKGAPSLYIPSWVIRTNDS